MCHVLSACLTRDLGKVHNRYAGSGLHNEQSFQCCCLWNPLTQLDSIHLSASVWLIKDKWVRLKINHWTKSGPGNAVSECIWSLSELVLNELFSSWSFPINHWQTPLFRDWIAERDVVRRSSKSWTGLNFFAASSIHFFQAAAAAETATAKTDRPR